MPIDTVPGKSYIHKLIPTILPPLTLEESLEITKIYSVAGLSNGHGMITKRPLRAPHHSISPVALIGGGTLPKPGEISLAHHRILFLDEFPEFRRDVIESLRAPMEDGEVRISRAKMQATFPSKFLLSVAMNPCPCGYLGDARRNCRCSLGQIQKYRSKISGPILDRIDLHIEMQALSYAALTSGSPGESSETIRNRVMACRAIQAKRYQDRPYQINASMHARDIKAYARPDSEGRKLLEMAMKELLLSARGYFKILKVARTIADLATEEPVTSQHIAEAIQYRSLDRQW